MKKTYLVSTPLTVSTTSSNSINSSSHGNTAVTPFVSKKNEAEHHEFITISIEQWCNQNKNDPNLHNFNLRQKYVILY